MIGRDLVVAEEMASQMCSARWLIEYCGALGVRDDLAGAGEDLATDEIRDEHLFEAGQVVDPLDAVVLVTAVGVAGRVRVVLEQVDVAADAFVAQLALGVLDELAQDRLTRLVLGDGVDAMSRTRPSRTRGDYPTSRYRRLPFSKNTLLDRPHATTLRKRNRETSSGLSRRCPRSENVIPYSVSMP